MIEAPRSNGNIDPGRAALTVTRVEPVALRVGDDERNAAAAALGEHLTRGRIDLEEYGQRSAQAFAAHTDVDLQELFRDLPELHPLATGSVAKSPGRTSAPREATGWAQTPVLPGTKAQRSMAERLAAVMLGITSMIVLVAFGVLLHFWSEAWIVLLLVPAQAAAAETTWGKGWRTAYL